MSEVPQVDLVGLGIAGTIPEDVTTEQVWKALLVKIKEPNLFLPVTVQVVRPSDDGKGTYREMSIASMPTIKENIYANEDLLEVKFVVTDDIIEHVNIIHINPTTGERTLEFYKRHSETGERVNWEVPRQGGLAAIQKVIDYARSL